MLAYHPAFDANHCAYRFLHLFFSSGFSALKWDMLRIADFYYLFPHLLKNISPLPTPLSRGRKYFKKISDPYESIPSPKRLLFDLRDIQNSAATSLVAKGIFDREKFNDGIVSIINESIPNALVEDFMTNPLTHEEWFQIFSAEISSLDLIGAKGLKARTGLMEYRYDQ